MFVYPRKLNRMGSAFFCLIVTIILLLSSMVFNSADALVRCRGFDLAQTVTRNEIAAGGGGVEREFSTGATSDTILLSGSVDLNISPDASTFSHGIVTETTGPVWQVNANNGDRLSGYITANYQFNGLVPGDNKICSSPTSCIQVTNISPVNTNYRRFSANNDPANNIRRVREAITFTMDLTDVSESGTYVGDLQIELSIGPNIDGSGGVDLTCDQIL